MSTEKKKKKGYKYITNHGLGPGTLPKDVELVDYEDLDNYKTAIYLDRPLTSDELDYYDIPSETELTESNSIVLDYNINDIYDWICESEEWLSQNKDGVTHYRLAWDELGNEWVLAMWYDYEYVEECQREGEPLDYDVFAIKLGLAPGNRMILDETDYEFPVLDDGSGDVDFTQLPISSEPKEGCISDIKWLLKEFDYWKNSYYFQEEEYDDEYWED